MKFFHGEGVVLQKYPVREKDELVVLLTKRQGKRAFRSYGSRDPNSRKAGVLELFNTIVFQAHEGKTEVPTLQQVKLLYSRAFAMVEIDKSLQEFYRAAKILQLTNSLIQDLQFVQSVYDNLNNALDRVQESSIVLVYWVGILNCLGYLPDWSRCAVCAVKFSIDDTLLFSTEHRGFVHVACVIVDRILFKPVDTDLMKLMVYLQRSSLPEALLVDIDGSMRDRLLVFLQEFELHN